MRARTDTLRHHIDTVGPLQVICVTESWLSSDIPDSVVSLPGYKIIRNDRNSHGGGVAIYIAETIPTKLLLNSQNKWQGKPGVIEYTMCELEIAGYMTLSLLQWFIDLHMLHLVIFLLIYPTIWIDIVTKL